MTFGRSVRSQFLLDPQLTYLNHGTVGVTHRRVLAAQRQIVDEIERNPAKFLLRELADYDRSFASRQPPQTSRVRQAIEPVAEFLGVRAEDLAFVDNITTGANAVLRSVPLRAGDEIVVTDLGYGGVTNAAIFAARQAGATVRTIDLPWPVGSGDVGSEIVSTIVSGLNDRTRLLVVDHLTAQTALLLPLAAIAEACHQRGVLVLADGAHVPGNVDLDITSLGVDWYVANLHKWAFAPRSCGILWCAPEHQSTLHPAVISWGLDNGLEAEFDLPGTRDPSNWLAAPVGLEVLNDFGVDAVYAHNHDLVWWAAQHLAERWGTTLSTPESMIGAMATVALPERAGSDPAAIQAALNSNGIEVPVFAKNGTVWTRVSAQVYNERADVEILANAVNAL